MADIHIPGNGGVRGTLRDGRAIYAGVVMWTTAIGRFYQPLVCWSEGGQWNICERPIDDADYSDGADMQRKYDAAGGQGNYWHSRRDRINEIVRDELSSNPPDLDALTQQSTPFSWRGAGLTLMRYFKWRRWPWQDVPEFVPSFWPD